MQVELALVSYRPLDQNPQASVAETVALVITHS
jgi:hypothetical protein